MLAYDIISGICALVLLLGLGYVIGGIVGRDRAERIMFIRNFKNGSFAIIYMVTLPVYMMGKIYTGEGFGTAFFASVKSIIETVVLKFDTASVKALMADSLIYEITVYFTFTLVFINALMFAISLTIQQIWCFKGSLLSFFSKKDKLYIVGKNDESVLIYKSAQGYNRVLVDTLDAKARDSLYLSAVRYESTSSPISYIEKIVLDVKKSSATPRVIVINTGDDEKNMQACRRIIETIDISPETEREAIYKLLRVYVFGDPRFEAIYFDLESTGHGCISYVNKYKKMAFDFVDRYPLAGFLTEEQVDFSTSYIKDGVDINVLMIGFGKANQQFFLSSVMNNQFIKAGDGEPTLKQVNYYMLDKCASENNKNLNHNYYRYKHEYPRLAGDGDYFELPELPALERHIAIDINDSEFYDRIYEVVSRGENDANFIIVGFADDLENIDMAKKLIEKRDEWGLDKLTIFVKVKNFKKAETVLSDSNCIFIGNAEEVVYNIDNITSDRLLEMAQLRHAEYSIQAAAGKSGALGEVALQAEYERLRLSWHKISRTKRDSNMYCCLSLRSKLNLMGLDYVPLSANGDALSEEEYFEIYAGADMPIIKGKDEANGRPNIEYDLSFPPSRRRDMAIQEHYRWNSLMISKGTIPASRTQIATERRADGGYTNGKDDNLRRHGNLLTFRGLLEYRDILIQRGESEADADVFRYDYQILDEAYWFLKRCGFKIVRRADLK